MSDWFTYLKQGLSRTLPSDRILGQQGYASAQANLKNLQPFVARHWRKGLLGALLILFNTLLSFPGPLIYRYLVDDVILARQLHLLVVCVALLAAIQVFGMLSGALQQFYFTRFEQEVLLDIQGDLLDRTLRFPKSFFDDKETGYLMSRLVSDVQGLRWFFSSTIVYIASNILRFIGGVAVLFYLEWRLALATIVALPALVLCVRYFSDKLHILSHQSMERQANVARTMQESLSATSLIKAFSSEKRTVRRLDEQIIEAAKVAGIHDFIANLPQGYGALVGERGVNLSEGQKQRLAIARALIKDPDIVVLDEPTSALDSLVEKSIFDALPALVRDKTLFVVAHRLATIQNSDRILLLNENRLVDQGTHAQLMARNAYYRSLVANQQIIAPSETSPRADQYSLPQ